MRLSVAQGTEYWVVADGYDGALGQINLNWGLDSSGHKPAASKNLSFFVNQPVTLYAETPV